MPQRPLGGAAGVPLGDRVVAGGDGERGRRARGGRVDHPGEARRGGVGVAGGVRGAHVEGVAAVGQAGVVLRARARRPGAAVAPALEGGAGLVRREGRSSGRSTRSGRRDRVDRRLRSSRVVREGEARGSGRVAGDVGRAHAHGVAAVGGEVGGVEAVLPVAAGDGGVVPDLGGAREAGAVPVVAGAAPDGDLDLGDAGRGVGVGAAEPARRAARVPARRVVVLRGLREVDGGARGGRVEGERPARRGLRVGHRVPRAHAHGVGAVGGEAAGREGVRPVAAADRGVVPDLGALEKPEPSQ